MNPDPRALSELLEQSQDEHADAMRPQAALLTELVEATRATRDQELLAERREFHDRHTSEVRTQVTRAALLGAAGGAALVTALASPAFATSTKDIQVLQTAASIENLAVATYKTALTLDYIGGKSANPVVKEFASVTLTQHRDHGQAFNAAVRALGGTPQTKPDPAFVPVVNRAVASLKGVSAAKGTLAVVALAIELENIAAETYSKDTTLVSETSNRALLASVMGVEAQHVAVLLAVQALLEAGAPDLISLKAGTAAKLPAAAGSVGFPAAFYSTTQAAAPTQGAVK